MINSILIVRGVVIVIVASQKRCKNRANGQKVQIYSTPFFDFSYGTFIEFVSI